MSDSPLPSPLDPWVRTTLQVVSEALLTVDRSGRVTFMNTAAERLTGVPFAEARGRLAREVIRLERSVCEVSCPLDAALRSRCSLGPRQCGLVDGLAGTHRRLAASALPVLDASTPVGAVVVLRDVDLDRDLQRRRALTERLAALGALAAGLAHEVNGRLALLAGGAAFVRRWVDSAPAPQDEDAREFREEVDESLADIAAAAGDIGRLMQPLQRLARPEDSAPTADLGEVLGWALRVAAHALVGRARVVPRLGRPARVRCDEARLSQVLIHLLLSAGRGLGNPDAVDRTMTVTTRAEGSTVVVEFRDGAGALGPPPGADPGCVGCAEVATEGLFGLSPELIAGVGGALQVEPGGWPTGAVTLRLPSAAEPRPSAPAP